MQSGEEDDEEEGSLCLSKLCQLIAFARTGPEPKYPGCPDRGAVVSSREMSSSSESARAAGGNNGLF